ncbi:MAG: hypothetical protein ACYTKD_18400 [Planctomycetota bacterium]|jgi:hypothetical protein
MRHVNARTVLPADLLREVQRHCSGYVYVPSNGAFYAERRERVRDLAARGFPVAAIAEAVHVCTRRVRQILAEEAGRK